MSTEVKHGSGPQFMATITPGSYMCTVAGHYTTTDGLAAAGVTEFKFESNRPVKQMAELLALRSAFLDWFKVTYQELGGTERQAIGQVAYIVDRWLNPEWDPYA